MKIKNYFSILILAVLLLLTIKSNAQAPDWLWAKSIGGASGGEQSYSVAIDENGNVFAIGYFTGTVDFDPGPGIFNLNSSGSIDMFILKLDASGNFVWAEGIFGTNGIQGRSILIDSLNNIYVSGFFSGIADFDPGPGTNYLTSNNHPNVFLMKLNNNGNVLWVKAIGGNAGLSGIGDDELFMTLDNQLNIYLTGNFFGNVDFNPDSSLVYNITGNEDIFITKLDNSGNLIWAKSIGGNGTDAGTSIAVDSYKNVYVTGFYYVSADFDPSSSGVYTLNSKGLRDLFILKLDSSGYFIWAKGIGGSNYDYAYSIAIDNECNIYTTGRFTDTVDFDPDTAIVYNLPLNGNGESYISKYDSSGNFIWAKNFDVYSKDGITLDVYTNIYLTCAFGSATDFDPGPGVINLTCKGNTDIGILKLDSSGNFIWATQIGGEKTDLIDCPIAIDKTYGIYLTGTFYSSVISNDSITLVNSSSTIYSDFFVARLDTETFTLNTDKFELSNSIIIYPNPASGNFAIDLRRNFNKFEITISDLAGKIIYSAIETQKQKTEINTTNFSDGIYLVQIKSEDFIETKKIIVSK